MPLICSKCRSTSAEVQIPYAKLNLCPGCFMDFYKARVRKTVEEFKMFREDDAVGVAVSGGKDSAALLHVLRQAYPRLRLKALHVNLGIPEYSAHCQEKVEKLANMLDVELHVYNLSEELGISIRDFKKTPFKGKVCSACGTIKRHIFEELAIKAQVRVLATGHNLEDVAGVLFNNFLYGRWEQFVRLKPVLPPLAEGMASKVKPLIKCLENENLLYCLYCDVPFRQIDCPYATGTGVRKRAKILELLSRDNPYFRHQLLNRFLEIMPLIESVAEKPTLGRCKVCGFPSSSEVCAFCRRLAMVKEAVGKV
ncbi:MAG: ATP-binding protein [Candidatus Bathyarchaeia archaeon]